MNKVKYIVRNSDHDGYNQKFDELPEYEDKNLVEHVKQWQEDGYLKIDDEIYECKYIGLVYKELKVKETDNN